MYKIAIIEDIELTNDEFKGYLLDEWSDSLIDQFFDCETACEALRRGAYDLVITDMDLGPGSDQFGGAKIAQVMHGLKCPLLVVSGAPQPETLRGILGALGAWDYLQKPVLRGDFITQARQAITFAKGSPNQGSLVQVGEKNGVTEDPDLMIDPLANPAVRWKGRPVSLTVTEIRIVYALVGQMGTVVKFETLQKLLNTGRNLSNLRVHIRKIRESFRGADPQFSKIENKILEGYFWRA